ncbi:MAG: polymer-forming cytoskeletal protein [Treponematales bacterium]|jgi:cytoskeletal protein CcmA (bactofilin family)
MAGRREDFFINTIIGPGTSVVGGIKTGGFVRADGDVHGDVNTGGRVVIGEKARVRGNVSGAEITIGGVVRGNVFARERLVIMGSGLVLGNIFTKRIQADDGCLIHGKIKICKDEEAWNKAFADFQDSVNVRRAIGNREDG